MRTKVDNDATKIVGAIAEENPQLILRRPSRTRPESFRPSVEVSEKLYLISEIGTII